VRLAEFLARFGALDDKGFKEAFPNPFLLEEGKLKVEGAAPADRHVYLLHTDADDGVLVVGRNPGNDIPVPDKQVSSKHADLRRGPNGHWYVTDKASTNGTFIDGKQIEPATPTKIADGTSIRFGPDAAFMVLSVDNFLPLFRRMQEKAGTEGTKTTQLLEATTKPVPVKRVREAAGTDRLPAQKPPPRQRGPEMFIHCDGLDPVKVELGRPLIMGRSPGHATVLLASTQVSRAHAEVLRTETGVTILDMGSANGTYLCQVKIGEKPVEWLPGKPVVIGPFTLVLQGPPSDTDLGNTISVAAGSLQTIHGTLEEQPLSDVLTEIESEHKTGTLELKGQGMAGKITFRAGNPCNARTEDGKEGVDAVRALMRLKTGSYVLRLDPTGIGPRRIPKPFSEFVLEDFLG
jgi:pSer/pThr/pTyr-binding forkhead associated (FHA) protein